MTKTRVYLDYSATTPMRPAVITRMADVMGDVGNASSIHRAGQHARSIIEQARAKVGRLVHASAAQVIFSSGATESNNTVISGFTGGRILVSATEHVSVLDPAHLARAEMIPVHSNGLVDLTALEAMCAAGDPPSLVSVMLVNNETGVIAPIADVAAIARRYGAALHVDAVQAAGKIPVSMDDLGADYLTLSAHKIGGPQGVGALIIANGALACRPVPVLLRGGGQERRVRAGTENVAGIAGFGLAAEMAVTDMMDVSRRVSGMMDDVLNFLKARIPDLVIHGMDAPRVPHILGISVPGRSADVMLMALDLAGICVSSGSACSSGSVKKSHVLSAMRVPDAHLLSAIRISAGYATSPEDIAAFKFAWENVIG